MNRIQTIIISGPTAVGKTSVAVELCKKINGEIISADSRQVYKYLDIGTNKEGELTENIRRIDGIKQYLTDIITPDKKYSAKNFETDAKKYEKLILSRNKVPVIAGGTGLYIKAFLYGLDDLPDCDENMREEIKNIIADKGLDYLYELLHKVDPVSAEKNRGNTQRLMRAYEVYKLTGKPMSSLLLGGKNSTISGNKGLYVKHIVLLCNRENLYSVINKRCKNMINSGMIEETKKVLQMGYNQDCFGLTGVGYKHMVKYLNNEISKEELVNVFCKDTRQYAKRQITWFKSQKDINIINIDGMTAEETAEKILNI